MERRQQPNKHVIIILMILVSILLGVVLGTNIAKVGVTQEVQVNMNNSHRTEDKEVDINKATYEELKLVEGIGSTKAKKIVENRPYKDKHELLKKGVLGETTFRKLERRLKV